MKKYCYIILDCKYKEYKIVNVFSSLKKAKKELEKIKKELEKNNTRKKIIYYSKNYCNNGNIHNTEYSLIYDCMLSYEIIKYKIK